jgi:hypothetical protein
MKPLTIDQIDTILNRLLNDREIKPELSGQYDVAIKLYNDQRKALLENKQ